MLYIYGVSVLVSLSLSLCSYSLCRSHTDGMSPRRRHSSLTIRQHRELIGHAEGALGADVDVDGGEAEVLPRVVRLRSGEVQVPIDLRHERASVVLLDKVGEVVEKPVIGYRWRETRPLQVNVG